MKRFYNTMIMIRHTPPWNHFKKCDCNHKLATTLLSLMLMKKYKDTVLIAHQLSVLTYAITLCCNLVKCLACVKHNTLTESRKNVSYEFMNLSVCFIFNRLHWYS